MNRINMPNAFRALYALVIFSVNAPITLMSAEDESSIVELLPRGMDMIDETAAANYRRLVAMGEKAYPALAKELLRTTDATVAGRIISIFVESKGDKTIPRNALRQFYREREAVFQDRNRVRMMIAGGLGKVGERKDAALLQEMLSDPAVPVKVRALRGLAEIGGPESAEILKNWRRDRPKRAAAALETAVDVETEKAIDAIKQRRSGN